MRIGVYGGSFDPLHKGHIALLQGALKGGFIDIALVIPSARNNFKTYTNQLPCPYRYYMLKDCIEELELEDVYPCDIEMGIEGTSYTAVILDKLTDPDYIVPFLQDLGIKKKKANEQHNFFWIMGSDTIASFEHWYKPADILSKATLLSAMRPGSDVDIQKIASGIENNLGGHVELFRFDGIECSSSEILKDMDFTLCPKPVRDFIKLHDLYSDKNILDGVSDEDKVTFFESAIGMYPYLKEKRLLHTLNVGYLSCKLARRFGEDPGKALIAGALHDCAKELDIDYQRKLARSYSGDIFEDKKLLHSPAGAVFAREKFGIEDEGILDAICYHTTGRGDMTKLEKIVYLADKIEPSRTYTDLTEIRKAALTDLDEAVRMTVRSVKTKFEEQGRDIHPYTLAMMKDLRI
ncbi:MAG: bis(5'-nucleosyl)-tetraphosphatase (symmetrical) YqeK [Saccharofermentans sp.]|nr:bis(5'-nucleosyl)-tetraphosphatase (symmetrical) YqeK [Saccharofermentans sp.]